MSIIFTDEPLLVIMAILYTMVIIVYNIHNCILGIKNSEDDIYNG